MIPKSLKASKTGIEKAKQVLFSRQLRQEDLVGYCCNSRQPISKFFNGKPVSRLIFVDICQFLNLDWQHIAEEQQVNNGKVPFCDQNGEKPPKNEEQILSEDKLVFAIAGSIDKADEAKLKAIVGLLQQISGDTSIEIVNKEKGSIRLILQGSEAGLSRLKELYESGELTEVLGTPVEDVHFLSEETEAKSSSAELHNNQERYGEAAEEKCQSEVVKKGIAMTKEQRQAYLNLIHQLLTFSNDKEPKKMKNNQYLMDNILPQKKNFTVEILNQKGEKKTADFLLFY
ncbi:MAG: hypothetical protein F6K41_03175 [Symploca sp. SIO3E6]|nr:hypothetical protein [Caldora sp. SIO3E6]